MGRRGRDGGPDGLCIVDKPAGWTSHDVVAKARGILGTRRVGHAGTLDPDATGVLVLGVGRVTRLLRWLTELPKSYTGEIVLGVETTTLDAAGDVVATHDMGAVTLEQARAAARGLTGPIEQVPPMVSAVKVQGRRLHELARQGVEVERAARPVTVHRFELAPGGEPGALRAEVECSSGTYVRALAADLGHALGGGAHLRNLRRTAVGPYTLGEACRLDDLVLLPPGEAVRGRPRLEVDDEGADRVATGRPLPRPPGDGPWAVVNAAGELLALYEPAGDLARPGVVLAARG